MNAVEVRVRYETPDLNGQTRRQYNAQFGQDTGPEVEVPEKGEYLWNWFWSLVSPATHIRDGEPLTLTHSELRDWRDNMGILVRPFEIDCLIRMSKAWSRCMALELSKIREQQAKQQSKGSK